MHLRMRSHNSVSSMDAFRWRENATTILYRQKPTIGYHLYRGTCNIRRRTQSPRSTARRSEFDPSFDQLIDTTLTTKFEISASQARILAERRIVSPEARRAIVASQPHIFGVGRMMEVYHQVIGAEVQVFYSMDEALEWLGKPR
jgi:hypothetical protein